MAIIRSENLGMFRACSISPVYDLTQQCFYGSLFALGREDLSQRGDRFRRATRFKCPHATFRLGQPWMSNDVYWAPANQFDHLTFHSLRTSGFRLFWY